MASRVASAAIRRRSAHHAFNAQAASNAHVDDQIPKTEHVASEDKDKDNDNEDGVCEGDDNVIASAINLDAFTPNVTSTPSHNRSRRTGCPPEVHVSNRSACRSQVSEPDGVRQLGLQDLDYNSSTVSASSNRTVQSNSNCERSSSSSWGPRFRAPILGYEVVEHRAKFTVFKIRVNHIPSTQLGWFVFRRYTDFVRLQHALKLLFPAARFGLPPKRWFRDNFEPAFLEERLRGLQSFVNDVLAHSATSDSSPVCEFFCLDDSSNCSHDSIEESRARCETLEDLVWSLKLELYEKRTEVEVLKTELALTKSHTLPRMKKISVIENERVSPNAADDVSALSSVRKSETESEPGSFTNESQLYSTALDMNDVSRNSTLVYSVTSVENGQPEQDRLNKMSDLGSVDTNGNQMVS